MVHRLPILRKERNNTPSLTTFCRNILSIMHYDIERGPFLLVLEHIFSISAAHAFAAPLREEDATTLLKWKTQGKRGAVKEGTMCNIGGSANLLGGIDWIEMRYLLPFTNQDS